MFSSITSFITSSISSLPFKQIGDEVVHPSQSVAQGGGLWKHYQGVKTTAGVGGAIAAATASAVGDPISIFTFDKKNATADQLFLAKNAMQRLKTLRHPNIVKYIDSVDSPTHLHILTEQVTPLTFEPIKLSDNVGQLAASLGLYQITTTVSWLNNDAKLVHSNIHPGSLYTTDSGDWKLFGFDLCHKGSDNIPSEIVTGRNSGILPVQYRAPEVVKNSSSSAPPSVIHSTDSWSLGCLIFHLFNANFSSPQQLAAPGNIPASLLADYKKLLATNVANRLNPKALSEGPFFQNELVSTVNFLENLAIKSAAEKDAFFTRFSENIQLFPQRFCKYKILPQLTKSLDYGSGLNCFSAILRSVLRIGSSLSETEYAAQVLPTVVKLFSSNERAIRVHLLQNLSEYAPSLDNQLVNESIFSHVLTGFSDANATLRELTVKSLMHFAPKLNPTNMDHALRFLAKLQTDTEPAIRTNTGYCLAKIAPFLTPGTSEKVLIPAFAKMLRDPFIPARVAGLTSFAATLDMHKGPDIARKILPVTTPCLADDAMEVRTAALKLMDVSMAKLRTWSVEEDARQKQALQTAPNAMGSNATSNATGGVNAGGAPGEGQGTAALLENTSAVLGSLGSWAVGAVRNKMSNADANPPPKSLVGGGQQPHAQTGLNNSANAASNARSNYASANQSNTSFSAASISAAAPAPSSSVDDDFFDDFNSGSKGGDDDSDDGFSPVALSLTTKKEKKETPKRKESTEKKEKKKSILSGASGTNSSTVTKSSNSLDSWNFDMDETSGGGGASNDIDGLDDWGSSTSASSSKKQSSSDAFDLMGTSSLSASKPKTSPSSDPFASLSLSTSKPASTGGLSLAGSKPKTTVTPKPAAVTPIASTTTKKAGVDDWGDFLNS